MRKLSLRMFSKEEARELKTLFWTAFGKYMGKHNSASGSKVKWVNYKTGVNDIYIRLHCDAKKASISIDLQHQDEGIRELFLEQFQQLKAILDAQLKEEWDWNSEHYTETGQKIVRISKTRNGVNLFRKDDWKEIFEFYESRMVALDAFWSEFGELFIMLSR
ncbi:MAG: DUF4268 domain-containing protein [Flavobacteriales bacterium]|nr:DUF4268 domain-containing protein [Flavobacteriales bacterium]